MTLHVPTLILALLLGFLLLTLELAVSLPRLRNRPELRIWTIGCWALLAGFCALALRPVIPMWLSVVAGNSLICIGMLHYNSALHRLLGRPVNRLWMTAGMVIAPLGIVAMLGWPLNQRTSVLSLVFAAILVPCVVLIVQYGWRAERSLRTVAVTMALAVAALLVRAAHSWTHPLEYTDLMQASLGQGLTFLMAFMCMMGAGVGFVLAVFERVASQLEALATTDGLTGCVNRATTDAMLVHELQRGRRIGAPVTFVLLDLDHFKKINDRHGHRTGDTTLRMTARTIRDCLRQSDVLGRTGGEEFGLVLPGTDLPGAMRLTEKIRAAVEAMPIIDDRAQPVRVTLSAGIAVATPDDTVSPDHLYGRADKALYAAKRAGRNRVQTYGGKDVSTFAPLGP
ncbi:GGDEF domain-containing protein [Ideonella sp. A 288]|uniref:GGDEF domain-containing protein n=1 Tax=Ideonella sp. A 288 TaxID=1962181 RepID=UPI000B4BE1F0|nr:GGDEF domain-containing protein [Ideonella sp. A 288]